MKSGTNLTQAFVKFAQNADFIEHFPLVAMFVIVGDSLAKISRQFSIDHIFLDLLELQNKYAIK